MRTALIAALLPLAAGAAVAQTPPAPTAPQISVDTLKTVTERLSSNEFEGRAPATEGEKKTVAYLIERFRAAGLQPGNNGSWTQDVPLVEITANNVQPLTFVGGRGGPIALNYRTDMVIGTYRVTPQINLANSDVVFVGYGINAPERGWNDYEGVDVRGKTVIILINDPDWQTQGLEGTFGGRAMTYYGRWTYKYEEAARQGAAAAIIVHQTEPAAYGWGVVQSSWTGPQLNLDATDNHMDQSQAIGWMQLAAAERVFAAAGQDFKALAERAKQPGFRAVPLGLKAGTSFTNTVRREKSKNVVGVLPGRSRPNEYVMYTAHWDHLGRCDAVNGDDICNGALDNATGTAGLVALAEAHARAGAPERSMVFLAVTAEESGLLGSKYYAEHPIFPLARTVGGVNMDGLNIVGAARDFVVTGVGKSQLEDMIKTLVTAQGRTVVPEPNPEHGYYFRSDHFSFARQGVPMFYGESGQNLVNGGAAAGKAAADDYVANRYHKPQDEYNPNWNWDGAVQDLTIYYQLGRQLADSRMWPEWYPTAEFRAIRERSRAGQ